MIKKIILLSIICLPIYILHAQQTKLINKFSLSGSITGQHLDFLRLSYKDQNGKYVKDTCHIKNGTFVFTGYLNGPTTANLMGHTKSNSSDDPNFTMIFLEPVQMRATLIEDSFKNAIITGSPTQYEFEMLKKEKEPITKIEDKLSKELKEIDKIVQKGDTSIATKNKRDIIWNSYLKYREEDKHIDYAFISTHPGSYLSPYLMGYYFDSRKLSLDSAELFFNSFDNAVQESLYGKLINDQIIARKSSSTGSPAPIFSKTDINGKEINLSSFKGKSYVLLDFWASWCIPCREITPCLKKIYQKFHSKGLDVISISWDSDKKAWLDAIAKDDTNNWYNIFGDVFQPMDNGLRNKYAIASIPTLILIDKNGIIIGRYRGDGEDGDETTLLNKLNKIFAE
jgi:peroxiredoxin